MSFFVVIKISSKITTVMIMIITHHYKMIITEKVTQIALTNHNVMIV